MKFQTRHREDVEINIINMIDVLLLLLIFFVLTTTFQNKSEMNITLPQASKEIVEPKPGVIRVTVDANSVVYVNDKELVNSQINTIKQGLNDALANLDEAPVIISADAETPHQMVVKVMDAARQLGLVHISFTTRGYEEDE